MIGPFGLRPNQTMNSRALGLARPLHQQGHAVKLFMPPWHTPQEADTSWQEDGVDLRYTPLAGGILGISRLLVREVLAWKPDVVHCFKPKAYSGLAAWWLWQFHRHRLRLVVDTDDWEGWGGWNDLSPYTPLQKHFFAWQEQWGMRHCHALTTASRALQTIAWSMGIAPDTVAYVPNGSGLPGRASVADVAARRQALGLADRPVLLLYSRLFEFDTARLVAIVAALKTAVPHLTLLNVGAGLHATTASAFQSQLAAAGLHECVVDVGWLDLPQVPATLAAADVGIYLMEDTLLNRTKCPVKLADMVYAGLPVVAEAVGQVTEYVRHGENGFLCASGDQAGITAVLMRLLQSPEERHTLSQAAIRHSEQFQWPRLAQKVAQTYADPPLKNREG